MRSVIILFISTLFAFNGFAQEKKDFGKNTGYVYVKVNGVHPDSLLIEDGDVKIAIGKIGSTYVDPIITNKTNGMMYVDYNNSYFVIDGKTAELLPGKTYMKDVNSEIKNDKIAPGTQLNPSLVSPFDNGSGVSGVTGLFNDYRTKKVYKETGKPANEKMVLVILKDDGSKITKEFNFEVMSAMDVDKIVRAAKKKR